MALRSVSTLSDLPVVVIRVGALDTAWKSRNESISALESQVASKDGDIVAKLGQVNGLNGCHRIAEEVASLMCASIREHGRQLRAVQAACSSAGVTWRSAECQLQVV